MTTSWRAPAAALALGVIGMLAGARPASAQSVDTPFPEHEEFWTTRPWVGDITFLASNALIGGLTAGVTQRLRGGEFSTGFARGAGGGAVAYLGRRVGARRFDGAGLLGRQVSAVGVSMVRNAGEGLRPLERVMFPLGPLHLYVDRSDGVDVQPKIHILALGQALRLAFQDETEFDWRATVSAGAPVFRSPGRLPTSSRGLAYGLVTNGSIVLGDAPDGDPDQTFAHERVHVLQSDFAFLTWSDPLEARLADRTAFTRVLYRHLDFGLTVQLVGIGADRLLDIDYFDQPHEIEAHFLGAR